MTKITKYFCLCGDKFEKKADARTHISHTENLKGHWHHKLCKQKWHTIIWQNCFAGKHKNYLKLAGCFLIFSGLIHHFGIQLILIEAVLIGGGIGLLI